MVGNARETEMVNGMVMQMEKGRLSLRLDSSVSVDGVL